MHKFLRRLSYLLHREQLEQDLADEMQAHREMMGEQRRPAFGNALRLREDSRAAWGWVWLDRLRQDLAYAVRILWRSPAFTLTAVTVLALGEGVNLAGINLFDAALFHRVTVRDASTLLRLRRFSPSGMNWMFSFSAAEFYRKHSNAFSYLVTESPTTDFFGTEDPIPRSGRFVSGNYFTALGVTPASGRLLEERDAQPSAPLVVALGYGYWQQQFGGDPKVIGQVLHLNGQPATVVGVVPGDFKGLAPEDTELWVPADARSRSGFLFGKPKPGVTLNAADAELTALVPLLRQQDPRSVEPGEVLRGEALLGIPRKQLPAAGAVMIALVVMVLLAACANLGNILLARGLSRAQEIRTRIAVGAGRWRVIRQLVTENLVLALLGGGLGMFVGHFLARLLLYLTDAPPDFRIVTDGRMIAAAGILTMIAAVAFGLLPALQSTRPAPKTMRARRVLVGIQVAVSCVLLILSSLLTRSVQRTLALDLRFDYKHMAWIEPQSDADLPQAAALARLEEMSARLARLPGVDQVTSAGMLPLGNGLRLISVPNSPPVSLNDVAPSYFQAMSLPLVRGRVFRPGEVDAVMVSESAARAVWGTTNPVGQTWDLSQSGIVASTYRGRPPVPSGPTIVVGVVKDSGANLIAAPDSVEAYVVRGSILPTYQTLIIHGTGDPAVLAGQSARAVMLPGVRPVTGTLAERLRNREDELHSFAAILGLMGGAAVLLAAIGIFGLLAFAVAQRTREIGIRKALGAPTVSVLWLLARQYSVALAVGMTCGIAIAAAAAQLMRGESEFYQLSMRDPAGYLGGLGAFAVVAVIAALAPAMRALRINPATALRWE